MLGLEFADVAPIKFCERLCLQRGWVPRAADSLLCALSNAVLFQVWGGWHRLGICRVKPSKGFSSSGEHYKFDNFDCAPTYPVELQTTPRPSITCLQSCSAGNFRHVVGKRVEAFNFNVAIVFDDVSEYD